MFHQELRSRLQAFIDSAIPAEVLRDWCDSHVQKAQDELGEGSQALHLFDSAWTGTIDVDMGNITEGDLRAELKAALGDAQAFVGFSS